MLRNQNKTADNIELIVIGENSEIVFREPIVVKTLPTTQEMICSETSEHHGGFVNNHISSDSGIVKTRMNLVFKNKKFNFRVLSEAIERHQRCFFLYIDNKRHEIGHIIEYSPISMMMNEFEIVFAKQFKTPHVYPPHPVKKRVLVKDFGDIEDCIDCIKVTDFLSKISELQMSHIGDLFLHTYQTINDVWDEPETHLKIMRWETMKETNAWLVSEHQANIESEERRKSELERKELAEYQRLKAKFEEI